tara:strand:- start:1215 stop:1469 length:255 start_codon:yes stop_codon:yes gene_type:complete
MAKKKAPKAKQQKIVSGGAGFDVSTSISKSNQQHDVPKSIENFNRVKPVEAFGKAARPAATTRKAEKKKKTRGKVKPEKKKKTI